MTKCPFLDKITPLMPILKETNDMLKQLVETLQTLTTSTTQLFPPVQELETHLIEPSVSLQKTNDTLEQMLEVLRNLNALPTDESQIVDTMPQLQPTPVNNQSTTINNQPTTSKPERPNLFLESPLFNRYKSDVEIDKKLAGNNPPERDEPRPSPFIDTTCEICGKNIKVHASTVYKEGGVLHGARCGRCSRKARENK